MTASASRILTRDIEAQWAQVREQGHASEARQPRRIWAVEALKNELLPEEWDAATRAVRDCSAATGVNPKLYDERVQGGGGSDYGLAARISAVQRLTGLRQAAFTRTKATKSPACVDCIVRLDTLPEIALALGYRRSRGPQRQGEADTRPVKPLIRLVLIAMANYYLDCDAELSSWRGA